MKDKKMKIKDTVPQIFNVTLQTNLRKYSRRKFIEAAIITAGTVAISGCQPSLGDQKSNTDPNNNTGNSPTKFPDTPTRRVTGTPTRTFTPTPVTLTATTKNQGINLRTGPGTNYPTVGSLAINVPVKITGQLEDGSWFSVRVNIEHLPMLKNQSVPEVKGWIRHDLLTLDPSMLDMIPVVTPAPTATPLPNTPIPPGGEGIQYKFTDSYGNIQYYTLPCGAPIPPGAACTCNCVTVCSCVGHVAPVEPPVCSCDAQGGEICTCDLVTYWYPN